jgi:hypothetical protein
MTCQTVLPHPPFVPIGRTIPSWRRPSAAWSRSGWGRKGDLTDTPNTNRLASALGLGSDCKAAGEIIVAGSVNAFLKVSVVLSLLGAAVVGYYHSGQDAELARRAEEARLPEAQAQARSAAEKAAIQDRYQTCVNSADLAYNSNWALNCEKLAEKQTERRSECLASGTMRKDLCEVLYHVPPGRNCALPLKILRDLEYDKSSAREMCLRESQAGPAAREVGPPPGGLQRIYLLTRSAIARAARRLEFFSRSPSAGDLTTSAINRPNP